METRAKLDAGSIKVSIFTADVKRSCCTVWDQQGKNWEKQTLYEILGKFAVLIIKLKKI